MPRTILEVFLSSTAEDLTAYRDAVHGRLMRIEFFRCVRQEEFGARDAHAVAFCREKACAADLFVGLIGLRRGWEPDNDNAKRSITEMEHDWAKGAGSRRYLWVTPDDFRVPGNLRESAAKHKRQLAFRKRVMAGGERIVSQKGFGTPELLASEIAEHLLAQVVTSDLIKQLRPEFARQGGSAEEQGPAIAAAVEKLSSDDDVDLLALARDPKGVELAELEAKLEARAGEHEAAGERERKASAEYWRHVGALASLRSIRKAREAYAKAAALDPGDVEALSQSGWLAMQAGDLAASERAFQHVLGLKEGLPPDRAGYWVRLGLGDVAKARGSLGQALEAYRTAGDEAARRAKANADNTHWQRDLSVSHNRIGDVLVPQGKLADALAAFQASLAIAERLAKADAANTRWQGDLSVSYSKIGDVLVAQGKLGDALAAFQACLAIRERLAKADVDNTDWQRDLSVSHNKVGGVLVAQGNLTGALAAFKAALAIAERLAKADSANAGWQRDLSVSHNKVGDVLAAQGNLMDALAASKASLAIAKRLAKADPANAGWQRDLSVSQEKLGDVLVQQGNLAEALAGFKAALAIRKRLANADPANAGWQRDLSVSHERVGTVLAAQGNLADALAAFEDALAIAERLANADPANAGWQADLAASHGNPGRCL